jgi:hypothetical protein
VPKIYKLVAENPKRLQENRTVRVSAVTVFFSGEGPRSRRYGRTVGLLCNPMMKMKMMIIFCPFPSNGAPVE